MISERAQLVSDLRDSRERIRTRLYGEVPVYKNGRFDRWRIQNSRVRQEDQEENSYEETFRTVLRGQSIADLLRGRRSMVVVDLMASTGTLANLFQSLPDIPNKRGIAVALTDQRTDGEIARDEQLGIALITGDLTYPKTWRNLRSHLAGEKTDLIMARGYGAGADMPTNLDFYGYTLNQMWDMSGENNSNILLEMPPKSVFDEMGIEHGDIRFMMNKTGADYYIDTFLHHTLRIMRQGNDSLDLDKAINWWQNPLREYH